MVNFSLQFNSFVLVFLTLQVVQHEAGKITSKVSANKSLNAVVELPKVYDEKILTINEARADEVAATASTDLEDNSRQADSTKFSYFYVGRWTWHIPLWFTLWFSFYVFWNVIRSIYGHTVRSSLKFHKILE